MWTATFNLRGAFVNYLNAQTIVLAIRPIRSYYTDISTIRARRTSKCGKLRERAIERTCSFSAALTVTAVLGVPISQHHTSPAHQIK